MIEEIFRNTGFKNLKIIDYLLKENTCLLVKSWSRKQTRNRVSIDTLISHPSLSPLDYYYKIEFVEEVLTSVNRRLRLLILTQYLEGSD